jgi:hypothetical protein
MERGSNVVIEDGRRVCRDEEESRASGLQNRTGRSCIGPHHEFSFFSCLCPFSYMPIQHQSAPYTSTPIHIKFILVILHLKIAGDGYLGMVTCALVLGIPSFLHDPSNFPGLESKHPQQTHQ